MQSEMLTMKKDTGKYFCVQKEYQNLRDSP